MDTIALNFRSTAGYVTDDEGQTYHVNGEDYPTVRDSVTFGRQISEGALAWRDRNSGIDPRLAGLVQLSNVAAPGSIRIDLGSPGVKNIRMACGDASFAPGSLYVRVLDDTTPLITISDTDGMSSNNFYDSGGNLRTSPADWVSNNVQTQVEFETTTCIIELGEGTYQGIICHIEISDVIPTDSIDAIDDPILDGETGNSATYTGFASGSINSVTIDSAGAAVAALNVSDDDAGTVTFDMVDISGVSNDAGTTVPNFGTVTFSFTNGTETETADADINPKAGWSVTTVASVDSVTTTKLAYMLDDQLGLTVADGDEFYFPTASNTNILADSTLETDLTQVSFVYIDRTSANTAYPVTWNNGALEVAPTMPADTTASPNENQTIVGTYTASAGTSPITYSLSGTDAAFFSINASSGAVTFQSAPDYENPQDADSGNDYEITVTATNAFGSDSQNITVNVQDVNEAPSIEPQVFAAQDGALAGEASFQVEAFDPENSIEYVITAGNTGTDWQIDLNTGVLSNLNTLNYFTTPQYNLTIQINDTINPTDSASITINVRQVGLFKGLNKKLRNSLRVSIGGRGV